MPKFEYKIVANLKKEKEGGESVMHVREHEKLINKAAAEGYRLVQFNIIQSDQVCLAVMEREVSEDPLFVGHGIVKKE